MVTDAVHVLDRRARHPVPPARETESRDHRGVPAGVALSRDVVMAAHRVPGLAVRERLLEQVQDPSIAGRFDGFGWAGDTEMPTRIGLREVAVEPAFGDGDRAELTGPAERRHRRGDGDLIPEGREGALSKAQHGPIARAGIDRPVLSDRARSGSPSLSATSASRRRETCATSGERRRSPAISGRGQAPPRHQIAAVPS